MMTPPSGACMDLRGTVRRIDKEDHYTLLHTKYDSFGPCGFGEEDFYAFLMTSPGPDLYGPQDHG